MQPNTRVNRAVSLLFPVLLAGCAETAATYRVAIPVVDLRGQPGAAASTRAADPLQESQLLYGERVTVIETRDGWARIEADEQPEFSHYQRWQGYPGWVPAATLEPEDGAPRNLVVTAPWLLSNAPNAWGSGLPMGARLRGRFDPATSLWIAETPAGLIRIPRESAAEIEYLRRLSPRHQRGLIVQQAERLIGTPYFWGGRSPFRANAAGITGVDCSGLVNLVYRSAGLDVPRDAHEQFLRSRPIGKPAEADLVFLSSPEDPRRIVHVMLYAGEGSLIEGPGTGERVRRIRVETRLGRPLADLRSGMQANSQTVWFGSFFPE